MIKLMLGKDIKWLPGDTITVDGVVHAFVEKSKVRCWTPFGSVEQDELMFYSMSDEWLLEEEKE